jgi:hypothetical protein
MNQESEEPGAFVVVETRNMEPGYCVVALEDEIKYSGPIGTSPSIDGAVMFIHPSDFSFLVQWLNDRDATRH